MRYTDVVQIIADLSTTEGLSFVDRSARIVHLLDPVPEKNILEHLDYAGIIPESFHHDSTEEKLYAKYCDSLLAKSLALMGMDARVITERADAADVSAKLNNYEVVGDAKAFRLSRTAKNQKDFKVEALNSWRRRAEYACLISPLYQYPSTTSQIYLQATKYNVTLMSYTHMAFLLRHKPSDLRGLRTLWEVGKSLPQTKDASPYWNAIAKALCDVTGKSRSEWDKAMKDELMRLPAQAEGQIRHWEAEKERIRKLSHDIAVNELIAALKIDSKIEQIRKNASLK